MKNSSVAVYASLGVMAIIALLLILKKPTPSPKMPPPLPVKEVAPYTAIPNALDKYSGGVMSSDKLSEPEVKKLLQNFVVEKDEFKDTKFFKPKTAPRYTNQNGFYLYFGLKMNSVNPLRLRMQYYSDDWLFIKGCTFLIDGQSYELMTGSFERDNDSDIWEWYDEPLNASSAEIVEKLANCKSAKVRYHGDQYHDDKVISASQLKAIKQTIELHQKLKQ